MNLTIAGPNLSTGSTFHVHKEGCSDLKRRVVYRGAQMWSGEFTSLQDIVEDVFTDHMAENDQDSPYSKWTGYTDEFDIFPCCGPVPDMAPEPTEETSESSLPTELEGDKVTPSSPATKGKGTKDKESTVSTKTTATKNRRSYNAKTARMAVSRRNKGMSWAAIGSELDCSPRTARAMFDSVKGAGAHYDSRLEGKGGRFRSGVAEAAAKLEAE